MGGICMRHQSMQNHPKRKNENYEQDCMPDCDGENLESIVTVISNSYSLKEAENMIQEGRFTTAAVAAAASLHNIGERNSPQNDEKNKKGDHHPKNALSTTTLTKNEIDDDTKQDFLRAMEEAKKRMSSSSSENSIPSLSLKLIP